MDFSDHVQETNITDTLKPCPFCGYDKPKFTTKRSGSNRRTGDIVQVLCGRCKARGPVVTGTYDKENGNFVKNTYNNGKSYTDILQTAADSWNRRTVQNGKARSKNKN